MAGEGERPAGTARKGSEEGEGISPDGEAEPGLQPCLAGAEPSRGVTALPSAAMARPRPIFAENWVLFML